MHAISSYRGNRPTHKQTTITVNYRLQYTAPHSAQCKNTDSRRSRQFIMCQIESAFAPTVPLLRATRFSVLPTSVNIRCVCLGTLCSAGQDTTGKRASERDVFITSHQSHWHIIDHFGDESFQSICCTGADN